MSSRWILPARNRIAALGVCALCSAPALAEDWWQLPFGANRADVSALYVERSGIVDGALGKTAWIVETLASDNSDVAIKKERVDIDCARPQYRGIAWEWTDKSGEVTRSDQEDLRWTTVYADSPMQAARDFVCAGPGDGARQVSAVPGN